MLHRAAPYDPDSPREMLRTTVLGDEPIQYGRALSGAQPLVDGDEALWKSNTQR